MTALKAVYQFQVSKSPRLWNDNPIESHRNNHRSNQEITTEITNNHRNNPLISDKWPFHGVFFLRCTTLRKLSGVGASPDLASLEILSNHSSGRLGAGSASTDRRGRIKDHPRGFFHRKRMWWKPPVSQGMIMKIHENPWKSMKNPWKSMKIHENPWKIHENLWASMKNPWKSMKIHDSWIFNDIHGGKKSTSVHFVCLATRLHFPVASGPTGRPVDFSPTWVGWVRKTFPSYGSQRVNGP